MQVKLSWMLGTRTNSGQPCIVSIAHSVHEVFCVRDLKPEVSPFLRRSLLVFIRIVSNALYNHEDAVAYCSERDNNEIYISDLVADKVESFVSVDDII